MNGIILINKDKGITSHDVVNRLRRLLGTKKIGHCGTLDPEAIGVLVLAANKATKVIQFLDKVDKEYEATIVLGEATDTYDGSGEVVESKEFKGVSEKDVREVFKKFTGVIKQTPPIYSAIKVKGKRLYQYAREGKKVEVPSRNVNIDHIELLKITGNLIRFRVSCSKGTYIRSLCFDIAGALGYPGYCDDLIRTRAGKFKLDDCQNLNDLTRDTVKLISISEALSDFPKLILDDLSPIYQGKKIVSSIEEEVAITDTKGNIIAIYGPDGEGNLKSIRGLW